MTTPAALEYDKYYHIYNRGNNREDIFIEARNYLYFLQLYAQHVSPVADTYAYCLLRNHFHFLVRTKRVKEQEEDWKNIDEDTFRVSETRKVLIPMNPSHQLGNLFNAYTKAINKAYNRTGSLFEKPFGRIEVSSDAHFIYLVTYIHLNSQKHGFVDNFRDWPYSSYQAFLSDGATRLRRAEVLNCGSTARAVLKRYTRMRWIFTASCR